MNSWELPLYALVVVVALVPLLVHWRRTQVRLRSLALVVVLVSAASALAWSPDEFELLALLPPPDVTAISSETDDADEYLPRDRSDEHFATSKSCQSCHPGAYASWHDTYHRTMTQVVTPETVLAPFDDVHLESRGRHFHLERRGDEFWVTMPDPDWEVAQQNRGIDLSTITKPKMVTRRVVMSTGSHHIQGYWVATPHLRLLRQIPWYYLIEDARWIPREDAYVSPPSNSRHFQVWNNVCIKCHSVAGKPGYDDLSTGIPMTEVGELGISCEACHGPADEHIQYHQNPLNRFRQRHTDEPDPTIINPSRTSPEVASQICAQCHSTFVPENGKEFWKDGLKYRAGGKFEESHKLIRFGDPVHAEMDKVHRRLYWADGSCLPGGAEHLGVIESPCYLGGEFSCLSCHSMHEAEPNDLLDPKFAGNKACLQCHGDVGENLEEHTHHSADSSGSLCYNCHMPFTSYALLTAMRSHRINIPTVASSARNQRPNACNLCHLDKTLDWSSQLLAEWRGVPEIELTGDEKTIPASLLWLLRGDAAQRVIAAQSMGWEPALEASGADWQAPFLAQLLEDPYAGIRYVTDKALKRLPGLDDFSSDFIGTQQERSDSKERAIQIWKQNRSETPSSNASHVLLTPSGDVRQDVVDRLLEQRDNLPLTIPQ